MAFFAFAQDSWQVQTQQLLNNWREQHQIPAAVISVQSADGHIDTFLSGTTQLQGKVSLQKTNLFGVGSITKTFIAARILQLQEQHELTLDDTMGRYFPRYPRWKHITIRQLLNMTSGIANFTRTSQFQTLIDETPVAYYPQSYFVDFAYQQPDQFKPGGGWDYSNTNYDLLGLLIEKITRHSLADDLQHAFFKPLQLRYTFYSASTYSAQVNALRVHGYLNDRDVTDENPAYDGAAGSMVMNSLDLLTWTRALFTPGAVLSAQSLQQLMTTVRIPYEKPRPIGSAYGLGVFSLTLPHEGLVWWYAGVINGYSSIFMIIPAKHIILAAQINRWYDGQFDLLFPNQTLIKQVVAILDAQGAHVSSVSKQLKKVESSFGGRLGVYAMSTANHETIAYRANERFPLCSTFKLMTVAAILKKSEQDPGLLQKRIHYTERDVKQGGYTPITKQQLTTGMTVAELCQAAIEYSDNTAVNVLIKLLGGPEAVTAYARSIGDTTFRLDCVEPALNTAIPGDARDTTTPAMMGQSLQALILGNALAAPQRDMLITWLRNNTTGNARIRAGVPKDWVVADKTGTGAYGTDNDIAVIWPPHCSPIILVIYTTQNNKDALPQDNMIASVTNKTIHEFMQQGFCLAGRA